MAARRPAQVTAYGRVEEDPTSSFILRSPVSGSLRTGPDGRWPDLGQTLAGGAAIGGIEPRLAPSERITLGDRLASARADVDGRLR